MRDDEVVGGVSVTSKKTSGDGDTGVGLPAAGVDLLRELELNNTREWWQSNKDRHRDLVVEPLRRVTDALEEEFGPAKLFRPQRDIRFSKDKSPYKTHQGAYVASGAPGESIAGWYVDLGVEGLRSGGGLYQADSAMIARYREAVDDDVSGSQLHRIVTGIEGAGMQVLGDTLKSAPRGYSKEHPRIDLLRHRSLYVMADHGEPAWMSTPEVVDRLLDDWRAVRPLVAWINEHMAVPGAAGQE